jgi:hypothetical protein
MSVFEEMYPPGVVSSHRDIREIEAMVWQTIERGFVREISVLRKKESASRADSYAFERWFLEIESGIIFSLSYFTWCDIRQIGNSHWLRVDPSEVADAAKSIQ